MSRTNRKKKFNHRCKCDYCCVGRQHKHKRAIPARDTPLKLTMVNPSKIVDTHTNQPVDTKSQQVLGGFLPDTENKWQPIDSAPADTAFLAYSPHDMGGFQFVGLLNGKGEIVSMMTGEPLDDKQARATHWTNLQQSPSVESSDVSYKTSDASGRNSESKYQWKMKRFHSLIDYISKRQIHGFLCDSDAIDEVYELIPQLFPQEE